jgi:predicted lipoprotein
MQPSCSQPASTKDRHMKSKKPIILLVSLLAILLLGYILWPYAFTVVPIEQVEEQKISEAFDPVKYVDGIWESEILPTIAAQAVNLTDVLTAMKPNAQGIAAKDDLIEVAEKYGLITVGEAHVYLVKGEAKVVSLDTTTSLGVMEIQPAGYDGTIQVLVYVGPRVPSDETSVRDGVGFIQFGDFKEQTEFGKVGSEINKRVISQAYASVDKEQLMGKTIAFTGAMTIRTFNLVNIDLAKVTIVPVTVEVKG